MFALEIGIVKSLDDPAAVFSLNKDGIGVLLCASCQGYLEVCKYLVEELGADVNIPGARGLSLTFSPLLEIGGCHVYVWQYEMCELCCSAAVVFVAGVTPFMAAAESGDVPTVEYLLDHGGDLMKADDKGCTILHHAVAAGCSL